MDSHSTIAVALSQALAARDEAALSNCLDGAATNACRVGCWPARRPNACRAGLHALHLCMPPLGSAELLTSATPPSSPDAVQEAAVVAGSVARLTAAQAALLLEELVARLHTQPQQAARLTPWLRSLLLSHGAVLAAGPAGQVSGALRRLSWQAVAAITCLLCRQASYQRCCSSMPCLCAGHAAACPGASGTADSCVRQPTGAVGSRCHAPSSQGSAGGGLCLASGTIFGLKDAVWRQRTDTALVL